MRSAAEPRQPAAVIVGLDCITGLQTARVLADHNVRVIGIAARRNHFCCRTNAVERVIRSSTGGAELVATLTRLAESERGAVLVPCTDEAVLAISTARERLAGQFRFLLPEHDVVEMLMDKERFAAFADEHGLPVPRTRRVTNRTEAEHVARELTFPVVLKPRMKSSAWLQNVGAKAIKVGSPDELLSTYDRSAAWTDVIVVQEWIEGGEEELYSVNSYHDSDARPVVTFVARKLRQWPPQTGTSSLGEECRNDDVLRAALDLYAAVGYRGLGYVEMKRDHRSGRHVFVEPNVGRPTGRSTIAEAGGVDLHYAAYRDMAGLPLPRNLTQHYGRAKWIYLRHDLQAAVHAWRSGTLTLRDWWRSVRGVRSDAVLRLRDPAPFAADLVGTIGNIVRSLRAG